MAIVIMDEGGFESLTMRQLGARLGVEAMSLYNHVANKDDILDGVLDLVVEEIKVPAPDDDDWKTSMKERAISARIAYKKHPWASALMDSRIRRGPARLRYFDTIIGSLLHAGFSLERVARAYSILDCYIYGFERQRLLMTTIDDESLQKRAAEFQRILPDLLFPNLLKMTEWTIETGYDEDADFEFGLNLILEGLERLLHLPSNEQI